MLARLLAPLLLASAGCLTPPAVFAVETDLEAELADYPPGTEEVFVDVPDGPRLSGVFVPAGEGAPVLLHLQESGGSVGSPRSRYETLFARLADLGVASLCVDWSGIGRSRGRRSPRNLERDARAMWDEAVRRAGAPERVIVRGISLGTLAAAHLIEKDVHPAAWLLVAPVLADTAAERYAAAFHGPVTAWVARWVYRDLTNVDLTAALGRVREPLVVTSSPEDLFLDPAEHAALAAATRAAGGLWDDEPDGHILVSVRARWLFPAEIETIAARLGRPAEGELSARLASLARVGPKVAGAVAADVTRRRATFGEAVQEAWRLASYGAEAWPADALAAYLSYEDPAGPMPRELIEELARGRDERLGAGMPGFSPNLDYLGLAAENYPEDCEISWHFWFDLGGTRVIDEVRSTRRLAAALSALDTADAQRQYLRGLLKIFRLPDRVVERPDGLVVQAYEHDEWHDVGADPNEVRFSILRPDPF